ncbi:hypothetical protein [Azotobacter salinestris]|uniref:hypothetical protein n=1 Tax=Azotobacter salinestris TaxID=69964 RepID=UPI001266CCF3|nr:hypothetical protein [Azotobacter salinestris]
MKAATQLFIFRGKDGSFTDPTSSGCINASPPPRQPPFPPENGNLLAEFPVSRYELQLDGQGLVF